MPNQIENAEDGRWLVLAPPFRREGDVGWVADLPTELHSLTDGNEEPYRSNLRLFEGARLLGPAHSLHETIGTSGGGAFLRRGVRRPHPRAVSQCANRLVAPRHDDFAFPQPAEYFEVLLAGDPDLDRPEVGRSEEHTSELQSQR